MNRILLPFLAGITMGLVVGFGVAYLIISPWSSQLPGESRAEPERSVQSVPEEKPADAAPVVASSLREAIAAIPSSVLLQGRGEISGTVTTLSGQPLEGVLVRALVRSSSSERRRLGQPPVEDDIESAVRDLVAKRRRGEALNREARTDAGGAFTVTALPDESYTLQAYREGYQIRSVDWKLASRARPGARVDFVAHPKVELPVTVSLPSGEPPRHAGISSRHAKRTTTHDWSLGDPYLDLDPGTHHLTAIAGELDEYASEEEMVLILEGESIDPVALRLKPRNGIRGRVHFPPDMDGVHIKVYLMKYTDGKPPTKERLGREGRQQGVYAGRSIYSYYDLTPGSYAVGVALTHGVIVSMELVELTDGVVIRDLYLPDPEQGDSIILWALAPDDEPIRDIDALLIAVHESGASSSVTGNRRVRKDGSHWLALDAIFQSVSQHGEKEDAKYSIEVSSNDHGSTAVEFDPFSDIEVTVRFSEGAYLDVLVAGYVGSSLEERLSLNLQRRGKSRQRYYVFNNLGQNVDAHIDSEGRQSFGPVQPGPYNVVMSLPRQYQGIEIGRSPVEIASGRNQTTVPLPELYVLTVLVEADQDIDSLGLRSRDYQGWWVNRKVESGRAIFEEVPAGMFSLHASRAGSRIASELSVRIPDELTVSFRPQEQNAMRIVIYDEEGGLARAGFEEGDVLIGIDGTEFANKVQMQMMLTSSMGKEEVSMDVLRSGRKTEIVVNPMELTRGGNPGGDFLPTARLQER